MKKEAPIIVRVNPNLKRLSEDVFYRLGLNTHAGINLFLSQMVRYQKIPFDVTLTNLSKEVMTDEKPVSLMIKTDERTKQICLELTKSAGLNLSLVIIMYLVQVVDKQGIPFTIYFNEKG